MVISRSSSNTKGSVLNVKTEVPQIKLSLNENVLKITATVWGRISAIKLWNSKSFFTVDSGGCIYTVKLRTFQNILFIATVKSLYVYSNGYLTTAIEDGKFSKCEISKDYLTITITSVYDKERFSLGIIGMKYFEVERIK